MSVLIFKSNLRMKSVENKIYRETQEKKKNKQHDVNEEF